MGCPVWTSMTTWRGCCAITASASGVVWGSSQAGSSASATWVARPSPRPSTATCARLRTISTSIASVRLEPEAFRRPFLDAPLHVVQEPGGCEPIHDPVIERHREVHDRSDYDLVVDNNRTLPDRLCTQDRRLRLGDDRLSTHPSER